MPRYSRKMHGGELWAKIEVLEDDELVSSIGSKDNDTLEYLGAIIYGNTEDVNEITGKYQ